MAERVVMVTGASDGYGFEVAKALGESPVYDVIMACRNEEKTKLAIEKIRAIHPGAKLTYMHLDLSSLKSVRQFVDDFHANGKPLDVLINNAGLFVANRALSEDQYEITMATNHLGHFLLTNLLLDDLKKSAVRGSDVRVVVVASNLHDLENCKKVGGANPIDFDDLFLEKEGSYTHLQAYKNSKLANVMFSHHLAKLLNGTGVVVNCLCPGFSPSTELGRSVNAVKRFFIKYVFGVYMRIAGDYFTPQQGASAILNLAIGEKTKGISGKFFFNGVETKPSDESLNEEAQLKLWELSARYTNLNDDK